MELTETKLQNFLKVVDKTENLEGLSSRHKEILDSRYRYHPISCYEPEFFKTQEFRSKIVMWCALATIVDLPDKILVDAVVMILTTEYGGLTLEEITLALKMNIVGQFPEVVNSYNSFSIKFMCSVLNHYKKFRLEAENAYQDLRSTLLIPEKVELSSFQEDYITGAGIIADSFKLHNNQEVIGGFLTGFDYMSRLGILEYDQAEFDAEVDNTVKMMHDNGERIKRLSSNKFEMKTLFGDEKAIRAAAESIAKEELCKKFIYNINPKDLVTLVERCLQDAYQLSDERVEQELAAIPPRIVITPYNQKQS